MHPPTSVTPTDSTAQAQTGDRVVAALRAAAEATGVSFDYLLAQANQESRLNPQAHNRHSSAAGLFQFTGATWLDMIKRHGASYGLGDVAAAVTRDANGRLHVADKQTRHAILDLRRNPEISAIMAAEYAKDNQRTLQARLGRPVAASDLYLAHFLGAAGAAKVLQRMAEAPKDDAAGLLPDAAHANSDMFQDGGGGARSVASLYHTVQARFRHAMGAAYNSPVIHDEMADLRPEPRPAEGPQIAALGPDAAAAAPAAQTPAPPPEPPTRYFPVPIPPPLSQPRADGVTMRGLIEAMDEKG
ncbi:MAG: transglycosylase SLT domain-containing protein [Magnetospirillum sp.]|nr:transglycosylase SLT domain-containing protein [Magnetospirillum sp.]